jgi:excinuclease ABC subunit B
MNVPVQMSTVEVCHLLDLQGVDFARATFARVILWMSALPLAHESFLGFCGGVDFKLNSDYQPQGDQPQAIQALVESVRAGNQRQTLLGVTGSGKTFTMANMIQQLQRPTLILSHNKTLAAQLYSEFKSFFPDNAVEYFVSFYDYYQPEAYIPQTDTYIEKDSSINDEIERLRIAASSSLISRKDVIVIASVSCIYGLGSPDDFKEMMIPLAAGMEISRDEFLERLVEVLYERNDVAFKRGTFRVRGEVVDIFPAYMETAIRVEFWGDEIESIRELDPLTGSTAAVLELFSLYPATQYATPKEKIVEAVPQIRAELEEQIAWFESQNLLLEAQRIRMRTEYDIELLQEMGFCTGIENYSRYLSGRKPGERPFCLIDFFPDDFLLFIDESHATLPQVRAMYNGDRARKERLVEYGFRLPSAMDNRPQTFEEFESITDQTIYVSATPAAHELEVSTVVAEQVIRPTGLIDPEMEIRPIKGQVEDFIGEVRKAVEQGERTLATTLTKRMSEDLSDYLREAGLSVEYLHSDIDAIERVEILRRLRLGEFDVLIGVNLLREGLDLPEVALVAILDADKEGFLRSATSLIQTAGRAARHEQGRVILYADVLTNSIQQTLEVTGARREKQLAYNAEHNITPVGVKRSIDESLQAPGKRYDESEGHDLLVAESGDVDVAHVIAELETEMLEAAQKLEFEKAAMIRDQIETLQTGKHGGGSSGGAKAKPHKRKKAVYNAKGLPKKRS